MIHLGMGLQFQLPLFRGQTECWGKIGIGCPQLVRAVPCLVVPAQTDFEFPVLILPVPDFLLESVL
ncbi:hypothetical protein D3Z60_21535 [Lachnospiraceae bacterium]|nr:hypothetical protein [Lachnospiraceae bacterium]